MQNQRGISRRSILKGGLAASAMSLFGGAMPVFASGTGQVKLQFMYPVGVSGDINRIVTNMISRFNAEHDDVQVEAVYAGNYDNTEQKVMTSLSAGAPPATWLPINSAMQTFLGMDALADLTDFARADDIYDDFFPSFLSMASAKDRLYGLAFQPSTPVLYYNKEAFEKAGIAKAPTTWDELFETARALTVREGGQVRQWGLTIGGGWHDWIFECWVRQNGMTPWQSDKVMFDSPESVNALEFWVKMVNDGVMPAASTWEGSANDFMAGRSAMLYHSTGSLTNLRTSSKFGVGVALMPRNKTDGASFGGGPILIARQQPDEHIRASWIFARWMTNTENSASWSRATGYLAVRKSSWESPDMKAYVKEVPESLVALKQAEIAGPFLQVPGYHRVREFLKSGIDRTLAGEIKPDAALKQITESSNREIQRLMRRQG